MADVGRQDLQRDRIAEPGGRRDGRGRGGLDGDGLDDRNAVGLQDPLGLAFVEHLASFAERRIDDRAGHGKLGLGVAAGRWRFKQQRLVAAVGAEQGKGPHRLLGSRIVGGAGGLEDVARLGDGACAEPAGHDPAGGPANDRRAGAGDVFAAHDRGRCVQEQDRSVVAIGQHRFQRVDVALHRGVADDVDRVAVRPGGR